MADNEKRQSKYFRDPNETPKSKYLRTDEDRSKYLRSDEDKMKSQNDISMDKAQGRQSASRLNATHRYAQQSEETPYDNEIQPKVSEVAEEPEAPAQSKGSFSSIFSEKEADELTRRHYREVENEQSEDNAKRIIIRTVVSMVIFTALAVLLQFATFRFDFMPGMLNIELSAFPELIISLAYGPVFGVITVIIKNVIRILVYNETAVSCLSNFVLDSVFIFVSGYLYTRRMFTIRPRDIRNYQKNRNNGRKPKDLRTRRIAGSSAIAALVTAVVSVVFTKFVTYPLMFKYMTDYGYVYEAIIYQYQAALNRINASLPEFLANRITEINGLTKGILIFNMPITVIKFEAIALVVALVYRFVSPFMHYRENPKKKHK